MNAGHGERGVLGEADHRAAALVPAAAMEARTAAAQVGMSRTGKAPGVGQAAIP